MISLESLGSITVFGQDPDMYPTTVPRVLDFLKLILTRFDSASVMATLYIFKVSSAAAVDSLDHSSNTPASSHLTLKRQASN